MKTIISNSEDKTFNIGYKLGELLQVGDIVCLTGDLGAGKTTMTKAIAKGLNIDEYITSPTFTIVHEYEGREKLYHFDVYRVGSVEEMEDIGYEEYFYSEGVCVIEWANLIEEIIPEKHLWINIKYGLNNERIMDMVPTSEHFKKIVEELERI
ncbi:tRNA (adenosine(37)-N6)-threonylcarbamoyltransferase complex ATPase subunit type 1 TsaE [Anaeromicrobium sediminis]|uniref:tRNA threonylcarbamoyladenosine biosynthesis protein TsaE n=1 Tax=Anaeromicrobium sediminis TaxID=1478221 RepID=A0A267MKA8_9FIRM|nr:tRNA (adenosine(37)-N6)-threonylcarbamoyltransferase complex ATPase subunit type 1 TsaE [Anaeromicrobium sediminis]PAB59348.1 tRNA (adenosine(37)-N6)-threonylcarbamoyltransferase complex ATPase subunit type 1 TsaE [Anaeromicrobium sediminis]